MLNKIKFLTAGESHGKALIGIIQGITSGLEISSDYINDFFNNIIERCKLYYPEIIVNKYIPQIFWYGTEENYNFLVMEHMGNSLENIFSNHNNNFSMKIFLGSFTFYLLILIGWFTFSNFSLKWIPYNNLLFPGL